MTEVTVKFKFRVVDEQLLNDAVTLIGMDASAPLAERVEWVMVDHDTIALERGKEQGWEALGLERINA